MEKTIVQENNQKIPEIGPNFPQEKIKISGRSVLLR